jgi:Glutaminase
MQRHFLRFLFILFLTTQAFAGVATVLEVVPGPEAFAKLSNGEVRFLSHKMLLNVGDEVEVDTEESPLEGRYSLENSSYKPSILSSDEEAKKIFKSMRTNPRWRSQCYNRAHIWTYEEFQRSRTLLKKTFIFFTNRYIRNYRYKWWFHVAPSTFVGDGETKKEVVLDWSYFDGPTETLEWTKYFIYSGSTCPTVQKYSHYENNQEKEDCYLMKSSMYFWQPLDLEAYEKTGVEKTNFIDAEVRRAYRQAF